MDGNMQSTEIDVLKEDNRHMSIEKQEERWHPSEELLDSIINDPHKHFVELLFELDILDVIELLNTLIHYSSPHGHTAAIECLWCWQDSMDNPDSVIDKCPFGLSPIVDELKQTNSLEIASAALRLIIGLCKMAPNAVSRIRLRHELNELHIDDFIGRLREKFEWNLQLKDLIAEWMVTRNDNNTDRHSTGHTNSKQVFTKVENLTSYNTERNTTRSEEEKNNISGVILARADADSGTFSDEDIMSREDDYEICSTSSSLGAVSTNQNFQNKPNKGHNDPDFIAELIACINSKKFVPYSNFIAQNLVELLREISNYSPLSVPTTKTTTFTATKDNAKTSFMYSSKQEIYANIFEQIQQVLKQKNVTESGISSTAFDLTSTNLNTIANNSKAPPPPPPPLPSSLKFKPPPPPLPVFGKKSEGFKTPNKLGIPSSSTKLAVSEIEVPKALKPKCAPPEGKKFRHLQWTKVPLRLAAGADRSIQDQSALINNSDHSKKETDVTSVWQRMDSIDSNLKDKLDYSDLDKYFCCGEYLASSSSTTFSNISSFTSPNGTDGKLLQNQQYFSSNNIALCQQQSKPAQISLINGKRSLSVNIFLKMCKDVEQLIENLKNSMTRAIGLERLKMLVQLLPSEEEQKILRHYTGDMNALGQAEKFLIQIMSIPEFKLRVEAMTLREEFDVIIKDIEPDLETLIQACQELETSECLRKVLYVLLHTGNYLNYGAAVGNAVGFKLNSLWKINELRATKNDGNTRNGSPLTLLHFIAQQIDNCSEDFEKELEHVSDAAKISFELLRSDLNGLSNRLQRFENLMRNKGDDEFFSDFKIFINESKVRLAASTKRVSLIEKLRASLAIYFCEEQKTFSLEECFKIFCVFLNVFKTACNDNNQRKNKNGNSTLSLGHNLHKPRLSVSTLNLSTAIEKQTNESDAKLSSFFLGDSSPTTLRKPRHSIHVPTRLLDNFGGSASTLSTCLESTPISSSSRRTSFAVLEEDRNRQHQLLEMLNNDSTSFENIRSSTGTCRRRASHSVTKVGNKDNEQNEEDYNMVKSSRKSGSKLPIINDEEATTVSAINGSKNSLEAFVDKALELNEKTSLPGYHNTYKSKQFVNKNNNDKVNNKDETYEQQININKDEGTGDEINFQQAIVIKQKKNIDNCNLKKVYSINEINEEDIEAKNACILTIPITSSLDTAKAETPKEENQEILKNRKNQLSKSFNNLNVRASDRLDNKAVKKLHQKPVEKQKCINMPLNSKEPSVLSTNQSLTISKKNNLPQIRGKQLNDSVTSLKCKDKIQIKRSEKPPQKQSSVDRPSATARGLPARTKSSDLNTASMKVLPKRILSVESASSIKSKSINNNNCANRDSENVKRIISTAKTKVNQQPSRAAISTFNINKSAENCLQNSNKAKSLKELSFTEPRQQTMRNHTPFQQSLNRQRVSTMNLSNNTEPLNTTFSMINKTTSTDKISSNNNINQIRKYRSTTSVPKPVTTQKSMPMTAAEKRQAMMKPTNSVSTASRPALIKTGSNTSESGKPRWI